MHVCEGVDDPVIEAQAFSFWYPDAQRPAVHDVACAVQRNEIFGFLCPSGARKSTTQNVLIGLLDGYRGRVTVLGRNLRALAGESYGVYLMVGSLVSGLALALAVWVFEQRLLRQV